MKAGDRYFMPAVSILQAINNLHNAKEALEQGLPGSAVANIRNVIITMAQAMEDISTSRLSDPAHRFKPGCENKCGYDATQCGRPECEKSSGDGTPTG